MRMIAKLTFGLVRDFESGEFFEKYFLSAIFSILAIRTFLHLFGYPQLGEGQFHIAHILWGGFFMMFAIILLLGFLNRNAKSWAAIFGRAWFLDFGRFYCGSWNFKVGQKQIGGLRNVQSCNYDLYFLIQFFEFWSEQLRRFF